MEFTFNGVIPNEIYFNNNALDRVTCNGVTVWKRGPYGTSSLKITANTISTVSMKHRDTSSGRLETPNVQYSLDGGLTWIELTFTPDPNDSETAYSTSFTLLQGESILFKGNNPNGFNHYVFAPSETPWSYLNYKAFQITGDVNVSGNVMSLIDNGRCNTTSFINQSTSRVLSYCFMYLFLNCTGITSVSSGLLPAITLSAGCYKSMFSGCTSLSSVPSKLLPALDVEQESYYSMFRNCTSLTRAPELPALNASFDAYSYMFYGCSSLAWIYCKLASLETSPSPTNMWVNGVASYGTFYKLTGVTWRTGNSGIPSGWTVINV